MNMMKLNQTQRMKRNSFTLIELLIVIGLLGALTALILPTLSANRSKAIKDVCDYNKAGAARALKQYENIVGAYPADMHNGLDGTGDEAEAMEGHASPQTERMVDNIDDTRHALTEDQADSLKAAGITSICSGTGLNSTEVAEDINVAVASADDGSNAWGGGGKPEITFDGVLISDWAEGTDGPSWNDDTGPVVVLWIAPTVDWSVGGGDNNDWSKGNVELAIDMEGKCPVPTESTDGGDPTFGYYMAYFKAFNDGDPARMIGLTCAGGGTLNP
ncbi:MAG: type II secretion system protein [Verrucomicrobiota bacterium]